MINKKIKLIIISVILIIGVALFIVVNKEVQEDSFIAVVKSEYDKYINISEYTTEDIEIFLSEVATISEENKE